MVALVVIASSLLQLIAGISALRLIIVSGISLAWTLLSAGIMAMAFRRLHALYEMYPSGDLPSLPYELLGLGISILIFFGVREIGPLLRAMNDSTRRLAESEEHEQ